LRIEGEPVASDNLVILVVAYDDPATPLEDFSDLAAWAARSQRAGDYEAAVVHRTADGFVVAATTIPEGGRGTWLGAGLGFALGLLVSPALPVAIVGSGVGLVVGNVIDKVGGFRHARQMAEVSQLVDGSEASVIVIADEATSNEVAEAAFARERRVFVPLVPADVDALARELEEVKVFRA
jgi:hypothetical protein